jgi:hypothetical protein
VWSDALESTIATVGILGGGCVAFAFIFFEMRVIAHTSALTTTVLGHFKESVVILLSVIIYQDAFSVINVTGIFFAVVGTIGYVFLKHRHAHN